MLVNAKMLILSLGVSLCVFSGPCFAYAEKIRDAKAERAAFEAYFPDLAKLVVFRNLSTPLTTRAITGHHKGAFYGIDTTPDRLMSEALQTRTPLPGLFLAGQDVLSPGIPGALWGGVLAAASVDPMLFRQMPS